MKDLNKKALAGLFRFLIALGLLLFLPAWTIRYWQAWTFLGVFSASLLAITLYLMRNDPELLKRRMKAGPRAEKEKKQKIIQAGLSVVFIITIVLPAVDHRLGWSHMPPSVVLAGDVFVGLGLFVILLVFKVNAFTSATVEVDARQRVISSGPYALVRHPMYSGSLLMFLGMPLALGSWWGLLAVVPMTLGLIGRLLDEEKYLAKNLPGYADYQKTVRYRLLPAVW